MVMVLCESRNPDSELHENVLLNFFRSALAFVGSRAAFKSPLVSSLVYYGEDASD